MSSTTYLTTVIDMSTPIGPRPKRKTSEFSEQRRETRKACNDRLFVQIVQCRDPDAVGTTLACRAVDSSANGLRVLADRSVPPGSIIDLWVDDSLKPGKFFLTSEVRWRTRALHEDGFYLGLALQDGAATDVEAWRSRQR